MTVQHDFKLSIFKDSRGFVAMNALTMILDESKQADSISPNAFACGCIIQHTHRFLCGYEIAEYKGEC